MTTTKARTTKKAVAPQAPAERKDQGYTRVPVSNVWKSDDDIEKVPTQKYDWIGIGDAAVEGIKEHPDEWLLVAEDAPSSVASNITAQRIRTLTGPRFVGYRFRGKITEMKADPVTGKLSRGKVWIMARRTTVDV